MSLLHASPSTSSVTALRYLVFGLWAVKFAVDPLQELAELPPSAYWPPAPLSWLSRESGLLMASYGAPLALRLGESCPLWPVCRRGCCVRRRRSAACWRRSTRRRCGASGM